MKSYDFLLIGGGIMGITTAIELRKRGHSVGLLNPDTIPHPLAASTDISKIVRMEYGSDTEYMDMADHCISGWKAWNEQFNDTLYHETGFLLLAKQPMEPNSNTFENASYQNLLRKGHQPERLDSQAIRERYPAFNPEVYVDGFIHRRAGYVESSKVVTTLAGYASQLGVDIHEGQTAAFFEEKNGKVASVKTREGSEFKAGHFVVCAGHFTHTLLPELQGVMKATGHPVFHLKPDRPELFTFPNFPVFGAAIATTGWYGFPWHPVAGVVKIANHGPGLELRPEHDERVVYKTDVAHLRAFLRESIPALAEATIVHTRRCLYCDTLDGHFWIDCHPRLVNLTVGAGGSGHAMKMGPVLGEMIAAAALGEGHRWSGRYRWRELTKETRSAEEARNKA